MTDELIHPKVCPLCGGKVIYTTTKEVYGKVYDSGYCYYCTSCKAAVTTHKTKPRDAMSTLADQKTKLMRTKCHKLFDSLWRDGSERRKKYKELAEKLGMSEEDCHFGFMDYNQLVHTYELLKKMWREKYDI